MIRAMIFGFLCFAIVAGCGSEPSGNDEHDQPPEKINWHQWGPSAFETARKENKLIHIDVGIEGCTACRHMYEKTYSNPHVIKLLNKHFICIQVDVEANPAVGTRYQDWAWPALIFLSPQGDQVAAYSGNKLPENFIPILENLINMQENGTLEIDNNLTLAIPDNPTTDDLTVIRNEVYQQMDRYAKNGHWGRMMNNQHYGRLKATFIRSFWEEDTTQTKFLRSALDGMLQQVDTVWGGAFVSSYDDWANIIPEKRTDHIAAYMYAFAEGYHRFGDDRYLEGALNMSHYLLSWMRSDDGTFYTSQEDDAEGLSGDMTASEYYKLDDEARRKFGIPPIDHSVYADVNAEVISAYVKLFEASRDNRFLTMADNAAHALIDERLAPGGGIYQTGTDHSSKDDRLRHQPDDPVLYLETQGYFGEALLDLYRVTADNFYLEKARHVFNGLNSMKDHKNGGYFMSDKDMGFGIIKLQKGLEANAVAVRFIYKLGIYSNNDNLLEMAEQTIRSVYTNDILKEQGTILYNMAWTMEVLTGRYHDITIIGKAIGLYRDGLVVYSPEKMLHFDLYNKFPNGKNGTAYICTSKTCSTPLSDLEELRNEIEQLKKIIHPS